jgi:hypothetical protein
MHVLITAVWIFLHVVLTHVDAARPWNSFDPGIFANLIHVPRANISWHALLYNSLAADILACTLWNMKLATMHPQQFGSGSSPWHNLPLPNNTIIPYSIQIFIVCAEAYISSGVSM